MNTKYIFITGGVLSSLGKGLTSASIATLLEALGLKVGAIKLDPYLNVDPGTMSPYQHGEVYVTDDGAETDLDLGHYYRYTNAPLSRLSNMTSGQVYDSVIKRERRGEYLGETVQVIPHITNEIQNRIELYTSENGPLDVVMVEIGGTIGDIESLPFLEAIRQFRDARPLDCLNLHLTYVPYIKAAGELKTKPTQHSVQSLRSIGIFPDMILCRSEEALPSDIKAKISLFCSVGKNGVIDISDVEHSIYEVPLKLHEQNLDGIICQKLGLQIQNPDLSAWRNLVDVITSEKQKITIGVVGKYVQHQDAYKSVFESLQHASLAAKVDLTIKRIESDKLFTQDDVKVALEGCQGVLLPGGFGERGWEGMILTAKHCRENNLPYFGICLGMQVLVVEFARNVAQITGANSTEMDPTTPHPVISLLSEQENVCDLGGTMRLGAYPCKLKENSKAAQAYKSRTISERHRHRYEFNNSYKSALEAAGLSISGVYENYSLCEISEIPNHPWMVGVQFHPEFKSKPLAPHPLFLAFVKAIVQQEN